MASKHSIEVGSEQLNACDSNYLNAPQGSANMSLRVMNPLGDAGLLLKRPRHPAGAGCSHRNQRGTAALLEDRDRRARRVVDCQLYCHSKCRRRREQQSTVAGDIPSKPETWSDIVVVPRARRSALAENTSDNLWTRLVVVPEVCIDAVSKAVVKCEPLGKLPVIAAVELEAVVDGLPPGVLKGRVASPMP